MLKGASFGYHSLSIDLSFGLEDADIVIAKLESTVQIFEHVQREVFDFQIKSFLHVRDNPRQSELLPLPRHHVRQVRRLGWVFAVPLKLDLACY